jgi:hypothetical protein
MSPSPEAAAAVEELRQMQPQWTIQDFGGHFRLRRSDGTSTYLCHITGDHWRGFNQAAIKGLAMAKEILKDEADRLALPRHVFGAPLASSAK